MLARKIILATIISVAIFVGLAVSPQAQALVNDDAALLGHGNIKLGTEFPDVNDLVVPVDFVPGSDINALEGKNYKEDEIIVMFKRPVSDTLEQQLAEKAISKNIKLTKSLDNLNSKHKVKAIEQILKDFKASRERMNNLLKKDVKLLSSDEKRILRRLKRAPKDVKVPELDRIYKVTLEPGQSVEQAVADYSNDPAVEYAELNYLVSICLTPNDPGYPQQWNLNNTEIPGCDINAPKAWDITTGSSEIVVAVKDSGVDYNHIDLQGNMWVGANGHYGHDFANDDNDPMDDRGHGTMQAGIIAARTDNSLGIAGVSWNAKIMAVIASGSAYASMEGIYYAVDNGADILSFSGPAFNDPAEIYAISQGVIIVSPAGNENKKPYGGPYHEHMIYVAATDSNDDKASFSNYGEYVDIAAPGVDIPTLGLGGQMSSATGTSPACPHVSGACALLLSVNADLSVDDVITILKDTAHPLKDPNICASGRLDVYKAIRGAVNARGYINLDKPSYGCDVNIGILVSDLNLAESNSCDINLTCGGDSEVVTLYAVSPGVGIFTGSIHTGSGAPCVADGNLQVADGQTITGTYYDANDGTGNPAEPNDTATADCNYPVISNVSLAEGFGGPLTFLTSELTTARVIWGKSCGEANMVVEYLNPRLIHTFALEGLEPLTNYCFKIEVTDLAGNNTALEPYSFVSGGPRDDMNVPGGYSTIQQAIDAAWDGSTVCIFDGNYTGTGNRDIDFKGRAITVRSVNGPNNCIINCQGTQSNQHRAFLFQNEEEATSILRGLTIMNGYELFGGAIEIFHGSPRIENCVFRNNFANYGGGAIFTNTGSPEINNCAFFGNIAGSNGGGIYNHANLAVTNCTFSNNRAQNGGGIYYSYAYYCTLTNCIIWGNDASAAGDEVYNGDYSYANFSYCDVNGCGGSGTGWNSGLGTDKGGNIDEDPLITDANLHISDDSPCADAGDPNGDYAGQTDIDGDPRVQGPYVDIGADEITRRVHNVNSSKWYLQVQDAIEDANNGDEVVVYSATYHESVNFNGKNITIRGADPNVAATVIDGNGAMNVVTFGTDSNVTLSGFTVTGGACGVYCANGSTSVVSNCIICDNNNEGVYAESSTVAVKNSIIYGNNEGIALQNTEGTIRNNTIVNNATYGIHVSESNEPAISNCILWNNGDELYGCSATYSCIEDGDAGTGNISSDPCFVDADNNDFHLACSSPCMNTGDPNGNYAGQTDIDGESRVISGRVDIGGDECRATVHNVTAGKWYELLIQDAIDDANHGDEIVVYPGTYYEHIDFKGKAITVRSVDPNDWDVVGATIIIIEERMSFASGEDVNSVLAGFTVTGAANAVYCASASPTISHCMISGGEGMVSVQLSESNATISNCRITHCSVGIDVVSGSPTIEASEISNSYIGIECLYSESPVIRNNYLFGNCLIGIYCQYSESPVIKNNYLSGNESGIGIELPTGEAKVTNNTVVGNGWGIYTQETAETVPPLISNCILWNNWEDDLSEWDANWSEVASTLNVTYCCVEDGAAGPTNISSDPCFVNADNSDFHIGIHSPCVDAGDPNGSYTGETDIDGQARVIGRCVDIGADEVNSPEPNGHWWKLDETSGTIAYDSAGNNDGNFNGDDPCWVAGKFGGAVDCNGVSDYFSVPTLNTAYNYNSTFTVAGWFKTSQTTGKQTIVGSWMQNRISPVDIYIGWQVVVDSNKVVARFGASGPSTSDITGTSVVTDGNWRHFALVYPTKDVNAVLYVDGQSQGTPGKKNFVSQGTATKFRIGDGSYASSGTPVLKGGPFNDAIDDVMIFNRALSAEEIQQLFESGS